MLKINEKLWAHEIMEIRQMMLLLQKYKQNSGKGEFTTASL